MQKRIPSPLEPPSPPSLMVGSAWILACAVGTALATLGGEFFSDFVLGLTLGAAQWLVVRPYLAHPLRPVEPLRGGLRVLLGQSWDRRHGTAPGGALWILASALGGVIGLLLGVTTVSFLGDWLRAIAGQYEASTYGFVIATLQATILGVAQWLVLRAYLRSTGSWLVAAVLGALVFAALRTALAFAGNGVPVVVAGAVPGAGYGTVMAMALVRLIRAQHKVG